MPLTSELKMNNDVIYNNGCYQYSDNRIGLKQYITGKYILKLLNSRISEVISVDLLIVICLKRFPYTDKQII